MTLNKLLDRLRGTKPDDLLESLRRWLGPSEAEEPKKPDPTPANISELKEAIADMRALLRRFGAAIGAGATAILAGVGYTQIHEIFPLPADISQRTWTAIAFAAGAAALIGAAWLASRFFAAQRRIPMTTLQVPPGRWRWAEEWRRGFGPRERLLRDFYFSVTAAENGAQSLRALELRGLRLERAARGVPDTPEGKAQGKRLKDESERITGVIRLAFAQAAAAIVERRSRQSFRAGTGIPLLLTVFGLLTIFGLADWSQGQRELAGLRKECAEATKAGATDACEKVVPPTAQTAADNEAEAAKAKTQRMKAFALEQAHRIVGPRAAREVRVVSACARIIAARETLSSDAAAQVAMRRCIRAAR